MMASRFRLMSLCLRLKFKQKSSYTRISLSVQGAGALSDALLSVQGGLDIRTIKDVRINLVRITNQAEIIVFVHVPITRP